MTDFPLEMTSEQRVDLGQEAVRFLDEFLSSRPDAPASYPMADSSTLSRFREAPPEHGSALDGLLTTIAEASDVGADSAAGSFLGYIPNGGIYSGAVGEFIAAGLNRYTGGNHASTGAVAIEQGVIDWMLKLFGLGPKAAGVLLSGGSVANLTAIIAARTQFGNDFRDGVIYVSVQAHHSVSKAARLAGIGDDRVRIVGADQSLRMDIDQLEAAIEADLKNGLKPLAIVASAGTTDSGAIDSLSRVVEIAASYGAWSHADAAYGGFFRLTERGRDRLAGIEQFDSITVDAHKSLFMPFGIGGLLVKDGDTLVEANSGVGSYMQDVVDIEGLPHFFALGPELTRPFRGLPVWLGLHLHGVGAFRSELDRMLDLAERAQRELDKLKRVRTVGQPDLSVVVFQSIHGDADSKALFDYINDSGRVFLSSSEIHGKFVLRLAFLSPRTKDSDLDAVLELIGSMPSAPS